MRISDGSSDVCSAGLFPGGTITGCPKVRCMQIIAELEGEGRGAYTGAMGYLDRSGDLDLNILIRSAWLSDNILRFRAGAGLVVDSDADAELAETRAKARGLLRAWGLVRRSEEHTSELQSLMRISYAVFCLKKKKKKKQPTPLT